MKKFEFWAPTFMCAVISLLTIVSIVLSSGDSTGNSTLLTFVAFLPVCFVFAGTVMIKMDKEIKLLRQRVEELEQDNAKN